MITSCKESNTEKKINEKPINVDHSKRHHTYLLALITHLLRSCYVTHHISSIKNVFEASHWSGLYGKILHG